MSDKRIYRTQSLCPVCLEKIEAEIVSDQKDTYLRKSCPAHGMYQTILWKGRIRYEKWIVPKPRVHRKNPNNETKKGCPFDCGLCSEHRQHTCTALIEVTQNCNLHCSFCFADSSLSSEQDPSLAEIRYRYESIWKASGKCNIQLSGGEPTLRDDLPSIVQMGKELGFDFIQVNTNGIRLAEDEAFIIALKSAGLSSIFLQFDGTKDSIYQKLRGKELLEVKTKAIKNCEKYSIGVVLVPTLVPKLNIDNIGGIIEFALEHIRAVRGVHFQPVSYFGRVPFLPRDEDRITLPEIMEEIEEQTGGRIKAESMKPPQCENSLCSFHGSYLYRGNGELMSITKQSSCCGKDEDKNIGIRKTNRLLTGKGIAAGAASNSSNNVKVNFNANTKEEAEVYGGAGKAKEYVTRNWSYRKTDQDVLKSDRGEVSGWDKILNSIHSNSFSISGMAFQDVWNVDLERVRDCCIHVVSSQGKLIPFCLYNITNRDGNPFYRV